MNSLNEIHSMRYPSDTSVQDIDVTPVMNMFVILIPFLISMAVFSHMAVIKFNIPPSAGTSLMKNNEKPKLKITVIVAQDYCSITRGEELLDSIPNINNMYDLVTLQHQLEYYRQESDIQDEAVIAVRDGIKFKYLISIMDHCKTAGFEKIGISEATADAEKGV